MNKFCFFIISTKKNIPILNFMLEKLNKYSECKFEIYVSLDCTEKPDDIIDTKNINIILDKNENLIFGNRIIDALKNIPYKNIVLMCDDFIVEEKINTVEILQLCDLMSTDESITNIILSKITGDYSDINILSNYYLRPHYSELKTSLQCGIWNKNGLIYLMKGVKSPWYFEIFANYKTYNSSNKFYALSSNNSKPIIYNGGYFVVRGKIVKEELLRLETKFGEKIEINDFPYWLDEYIKDPISFGDRIIRRIKITIVKSKFYLVSKVNTFDINKYNL